MLWFIRDLMINKNSTINMTLPTKENIEPAANDKSLLFPGESELRNRLNLIFAARRGNVADVKEFMSQANKKGWLMFGTSPLVAAMRAGKLTTVKTLIELGVQLDESLYQGRTALSLAVAEDLVNFARLLIDAGAQVNVQDDFGVTPLMLATNKDRDRIVELLLSQVECVVDQVDYTGKSALSYAAISGNVKIAKMLLDAGANPNLADHQGKTVLMFAAMACCSPLIEMLIKFKVKVDLKNSKDFSALMLCAERHHEANVAACIKPLVEAGADLNSQNKWQESVLMLACGAGQLRIVHFLTSRGADLNVKNIWGETPLMYAAERGHYGVVDLLLKRGSHVNESDERGETALMHAVISLLSITIEPPLQCIPKVKQICNDIYACRSIGENAGFTEVVSMLLNAESDVRATNFCGQTALMMAAMHGRTKLVKVILEESKANTKSSSSIINMACNHKFTALTYAALGGHLSVIKLLLKYEAFVDYRPEEVGQAINMAVICDYPEIVDLLLSANLIQGMLSWKHLDQSLTNACKRGKKECVKSLLDYQSHSQRLFSRKKSYFLIPVKHGHPDIVYLFDKVYFKTTAVLVAFNVGNIRCLELIHMATIQSNSKHLKLWKMSDHLDSTLYSAPQNDEAFGESKTSWRHLLDAVACGDGDKVRRLLHYDPSLVNKSTATGLTALAYACIHGHKDVVVELLAKGARQDKTDITGCSPIMFAARFGHTSCVHLLLDVSCSVKQARLSSCNALLLASEFGHEEIVQFLLTAGIKVSKRQEKALHVAAKKSQKKVMEILVEAGFDINQPNEFGRTPLMVSACHGDEGSMGLLLKKGADADISDIEGRTALSLAAECGKISLVKLLLQDGSSALKADKYGALPIWYAAKNGYPDVVEELLEHNISMPHRPDLLCYELDSPRSSIKTPRALKNTPKKLSAMVNNVCKTDGTTPLMHMCQYGFYHTVARLCGEGAITDIVNCLGQTALHVAALHGRVKVCNVLLVYGANANVHDKKGKTPHLLALSCGHLKLLPVLEHGTTGTSEDTHGERPFECSVENSASGSKWVSFKSRFRSSLRRQSLAQHSIRRTQFAARQGSVQVNAFGSLEAGIASLVPENMKSSSPEQKNDLKRSNQESEGNTCVHGFAEASKDASAVRQLEEFEDKSEMVRKSLFCMCPSLLDSDFDSNPFDCESSSSAISLDNFVEGVPNRDGRMNVERERLAGSKKAMSQETLQLKTTSGRVQASQSGDQASDQSVLHLQNTTQRSVGQGKEMEDTLQQERNIQGYQQTRHEDKQQALQQPKKVRSFSELSQRDAAQQLWALEPPDRSTEERSDTKNSTLILTDTHDKNNCSRDVDDPNLDIESMAKTTIHAAVNQCLQKLPKGIVQNLTKRATSCHTSAAATIQHGACSCGGHGLTVNLNQVFRIESQVKKKKSFHPKNLTISRAKYLTTGKYGRIQFDPRIGASKCATKVASSSSDDCNGSEVDDDNDESCDEFKTATDTTESDED